MTPVLTIAIPTRNRAKFLQKNLDGIIEQIEKLPRDIAEIFVSNNASTDGTDKILSEYASRYKFFRYVTQSKNLGANRNFYTVLKEACGEYVWLLGDDDAIVETCITSILSDIKKYNEPGIYITFEEKKKKDLCRYAFIIFGPCTSISPSCAILILSAIGMPTVPRLRF